MNVFNAERAEGGFVGRVALVSCGVLAVERTETREGQGGAACGREADPGLGPAPAAALWSWPASHCLTTPQQENPRKLS